VFNKKLYIDVLFLLKRASSTALTCGAIPLIKFSRNIIAITPQLTESACI